MGSIPECVSRNYFSNTELKSTNPSLNHSGLYYLWLPCGCAFLFHVRLALSANNTNGNYFWLQVEDSDVKLSEKAQHILKVKLDVFLKLSRTSIAKNLSCWQNWLLLLLFYERFAFSALSSSNVDLQTPKHCL